MSEQVDNWLWHVTYPEVVERILDEGLMPHSMHDGAHQWGDGMPVVEQAVYVNANRRLARLYIEFLQKTYGEDAGVVLLRIDRSQIDLDLLTMDHEDIAWLATTEWAWAGQILAGYPHAYELLIELREMASAVQLADDDLMAQLVHEHFDQISHDARRDLRDAVLSRKRSISLGRMMHLGPIAPEAISLAPEIINPLLGKVAA
jgi:hypothetical protein